MKILTPRAHSLSIKHPLCPQHPNYRCQYLKIAESFGPKSTLPSYQYNHLNHNPQKNTNFLQLACDKCLHEQEQYLYNDSELAEDNHSIPHLTFEDDDYRQNKAKTAQIISFQQFHNNLNKLLKEETYYRCRPQYINVKPLIQNRKKEIVDVYQKAKANLLQKLYRQEQQILKQIDQIQGYYSNKQNAFFQLQLKKNSLFQYFSQFAKNQDLLKLKMYVGTQTSLNQFMNQIKNFQNIRNVISYRNPHQTIDSIHEEINIKIRNSFLTKVQNCLNQGPRFSAKSIFSESNSNRQNSLSRKKSPILTQRVKKNQSYDHLPNLPVPSRTTRNQGSFANLPKTQIRKI